MTVVFLDELHEEKDVLAVIPELENVVENALKTKIKVLKGKQ